MMCLNKTSVYAAAKKFQVPKRTLADWRKRAVSKGQQGGGDVPKVCYSYTTFSEEQELALLNHCRRMAAIGYAYAGWQVVDLAQNMARLALDWTVPKTRLPTYDWFRLFMKRGTRTSK